MGSFSNDARVAATQSRNEKKLQLLFVAPPFHRTIQLCSVEGALFSTLPDLLECRGSLDDTRGEAPTRRKKGVSANSPYPRTHSSQIRPLRYGSHGTHPIKLNPTLIESKFAPLLYKQKEELYCKHGENSSCPNLN